MSNRERLRNVFRETLGLTGSVDPETLAYGAAPEWDSVAHMQLVAAIERSFDIMMETEDVIAMSSFKVALDLLGRNYGIAFDA